VAADGPEKALAHNTTDYLVADINALRDALGITGKMHVFGGSWGSTLALVYAIRNPEKVASLILRGIFLGRTEDLLYMYQGNAATFAERPYGLTEPGSYIAYPDEWKAFVEVIPEGQRGDMMGAYKAIFDMVPTTDAERDLQLKAALAWSVWEGTISNMIPPTEDSGKFGEAEFALSFAQIEAHFFANDLFLKPDEITDGVGALKDVPVHIVHGRFDQVCPLTQGSRLVEALEAVGTPPATYVRTDAGHSAMEAQTVLALTAIMDGLLQHLGGLDHLVDRLAGVALPDRAFLPPQEIGRARAAQVDDQAPLAVAHLVPQLEPVTLALALLHDDHPVEARYMGEERSRQRPRDDGEAGVGDLVGQELDQARRQHGVADPRGGDEENREGPLCHRSMYRASGESAHPSITVELSVPGGVARRRATRHMGGMTKPSIALLPNRAVVTVTGPDVVNFLNDLLTQTVERGELRFAGLLTPQGRLLYDLFVGVSGETALLDVAAEHRDALLARLSMYKLRAKVELAASDLKVYALFGFEPDAIDGYSADPRLPGLGWRFYGDTLDATATEHDYDAHRLAVGVPRSRRLGNRQDLSDRGQFRPAERDRLQEGLFRRPGDDQPHEAARDDQEPHAADRLRRPAAGLRV
jgi:proline iminopeptidase